jgi:hypothetical protein
MTDQGLGHHETPESTSHSIHNQLVHCNIPLVYSQLLSGDGICTLMAPLSPSAAHKASPFLDLDPARHYHSSGVLAAAIEVATGNTRNVQRYISAGSEGEGSDGRAPIAARSALEFAKWASDITCTYQRNVVGLEVCLPFPLDPNYCPPAGAGGEGALSYKEHMSPLWSAAGRHLPSMRSSNPFMTSLSSATHGLWAAPRELLAATRIRKPLTNVLHCRGFRNTGGQSSSTISVICIAITVFRLVSSHV